MPAPIATITNLSATGDAVTGPGAPTILVNGLPVACVGDLVAGPACVSGAITMSPVMNILINGRPLANMGSVITGVSPLGVPVSTAVSLCPATTIIV
jgi:uncharacterized Zn-binding protein involved in type VI secretion